MNSNELVDAVDLGDSNPGILKVKKLSASIALSKLSAIRRTLFSGVNEYVHRTRTTPGGTSLTKTKRIMVSLEKFKLDTYKNTVFFRSRLQGYFCNFFWENVLDIAVSRDRGRWVSI